uniref:Cystatin domain-containing protein n=2 Tax=Esox lucius TaxID=8010 RepID=A0A3P8ZZA5_ESOLU
MILDWKIAVSLLVMISNMLCAAQPGAPHDANMHDHDVQEALRYAVFEHNKETNDNYRLLVKVVKAQKQVVSGTLYIFTVKMVKAGCNIGDQNTICRILGSSVIAEPYLCTFDVWTQPWLNKIDFKSECKE